MLQVMNGSGIEIQILLSDSIFFFNTSPKSIPTQDTELKNKSLSLLMKYAVTICFEVSF